MSSSNGVSSVHGNFCFKEEKEELDEILAKRSKKGKKMEEKPSEEKTTLHSKCGYFSSYADLISD